MMFWVLAAVLTVAATVSLLLPLARLEKRRDDREHDAEVYRDQLREIDRDMEAGLIEAEEADYARAEVGRRLLKASSESDEPVTERSPMTSMARYVIIIFLPLMAVAGYLAIGKPGMPSQPLAGRMAPDAEESADMQVLVARAEAHLAENPGDGRGWDVLAPIYMNLGRVQESETAYRNAIRLLGSTGPRQAGLGQALFAQSGGIVTADVQAAFQAAEEHEPNNPLSSFFLALGLSQEGRFEEAKAAFEKLAANSPADAPWMPQVRAHLAGVEASLAASNAPGPDEETVAAAAELSQDERSEMIAAMVAGLDERLRQEPDDIEGWLRLIRSYMVLGQTDQASDALSRAIENFETGTDGRQALNRTAEQFGLSPQKVKQ
ncbi:c-type cytochrome biogenesis protein CcmI [Hoeflea prorocentri]|uniref:C-type cytochrome biogenesis protein CcmI n=1 Tax=Hoeflea prorocentri TaxID=1922333 RepID=A0A9X3UIX4_9HYPH|nr:c-type cytochrome biogenesis protein CcmI [Hoeflea prorocentri]MCY6381504.1 c-type cytochrome biogenesis protein CcmI [Hoeflea prorocentri]MDA5399304.1 c-type cytochrome biogenesis protein CcmI [Hoeflea prorocentri]